MRARELLLYLSYKYRGDWHKIYGAIKKKEPFGFEEVEDFAKRCNVSYITVVDSSYPEGLKECCQPPFVLFYQGNLDLIQSWRRCVTVVGSREAKTYGMSKSQEIASGLAQKGLSIVSGMARGIDAAAMKGAVDRGKAVGVLGTGLDVFYPSENRLLQERVAQKGLLLTEYPLGVGPEKNHFPNRNRIIAALSGLTLVGGSMPQSGTLITAGFAADMGREVACLPYRADEGSANNLLIQTGAALVQNADDVLNLIPTC